MLKELRDPFKTKDVTFRNISRVATLHRRPVIQDNIFKIQDLLRCDDWGVNCSDIGMATKAMRRPALAKKNAGFSILELVIVVAIMLIVAAFAIPNLNAMLRGYRVLGDARSIAAQLSLARMRAASESAPARLNFNLAANTFQLETCTSACNTAGATYAAEGGTQFLSQGVTFGTGGVATAPPGLPAVAQSALITFNSRGISVDAAGAPLGTAAIYITNNQGAVYAVTVSIGGQPTARQHSGTTWRAL